MNRVKIDSKQEQDLLIGLIISDRFIKEIEPVLDLKLLKVSYIRKAAAWCLSFFAKYKQAPKRGIQDIFESKARHLLLSEDEADLMRDFLIRLSERYVSYEEFNSQFILDQSEKYLLERKLLSLTEDITSFISSDNVKEAEVLVSNYRKVDRRSNSAIDILKDEEVIIDAIQEEEDFLLEYPGHLGKMFGSFCREDFICFTAPMKRGKSFWLQDFATRCLLRGLSVLFVNMEMSQSKLIKRFYQNFLGETKGEKEIKLPYFEGDKVCFKKLNKKGIRSKEVLLKARRMSSLLRGKLKVISRPQKSMNIQDIKQEIYNLSFYDSFYPDVVVIDYLDILSDEPYSPSEYRHKLDATWSAARTLAQEINGIVVTGSQSTRAGFSKDVTESDIAEDIRKLAHITHMFALNQNKDEKKNNLMRVSVLAMREESFHSDNETAVLYHYGIAKAYLDSRPMGDIYF